MPTNKSQQSGFTLLELIIYIVVIVVGLVGILSVMNMVVKSSADPMVRKQAIVLAESILEEIVQKEYEDPDGDQESRITRATMNNVDDYNGKTETLFNSTSGAGGWPVALDGYQVSIAVVASLLGSSFTSVPVKKITVTVSGRGHVISLSGYRADY